MLTAIDEEGRQVVADRGGSIVDGELGELEMTVPVGSAPVGIGALSLVPSLARSTLALVFLWYT